jgi:membrane fusion protein (multidrug efflux system)
MSSLSHPNKLWQTVVPTVGCAILISLLTACSSEPPAINLESKDTKGTTDSSEKAITAVSIPVVKVESSYLNRAIEIPGELKAFQNVAIEAKEDGFVSWIGVDRGSAVKKGEKLITVFCPELEEKVKEQAAKYSSSVSAVAKGYSVLESTKSKLVEAQARLDADRLTLNRLKMTVAKMPGSVAINDIDVQSKTTESDIARVASVQSEVQAGESVIESAKSDVTAAKDVLKSVKSLQEYLTICAPFDGIVTERNVHEGSMVGPGETHRDLPMLRVVQQDVLRLIVAVPEDSVSALKKGQKVDFTVPAFLGRKFKGVIARPAYTLDSSTRTMPVELNVANKNDELNPGMFATVYWQVKKPYKTLFVPATAVATDLKGTFVVAFKNGKSERISVQKGQAMKNSVEIVGDIHEADLVAETATNELKDGTKISTRLVASEL